MSEWQPIETAPKDGTWFLCLRVVTIAGTPSRASPELLVMRRNRSTSESDGYWQSIWMHSIADSYVVGALWAPIDALPARGMLEIIEAKRRTYPTHTPQDLPVPFGSGVDLPNAQ